ncbi:MAG: DHH family phosphoesterase [Chloroflexi bacterium]|nr:DHH family phosphoesterase [Chloroflexota bacterium]MCI0575124.1 DHH family phosphoesterase [Chloroflexota bacterium]MCI0646273.1 DHH family phosphoesterase [Chloroflexota bacterium]MCI0728618.1 DHH family phosphoesterase [Chloroflexota bacterium]
MADPIVEAIRATLAPASQILVITHIAPDGDALGSLTATGLALQQLDKKATLVCDDGLPDRFTYLPLAGQVRTAPEWSASYDLLIALDAGDADRLGSAYQLLPEPRPPLINIDHHVTNTRYGQVNLVDLEANATAEILFNLFPHLGVTLTPELAVCLLTGLVTDTLSFRTAGVTARTLQVAGALVEAGADLFTVTTEAINLKPLSTLLLWQKGLNNMKLEDGVLWTAIGNAEREAAGHTNSNAAGLGNMMADVTEAAMSAVLLEMANGTVSVGFRCRPPFSVSELATKLGGGGHHLAAGCTLPGPLATAAALVVARSKETIRQQKARLANMGAYDQAG